MPLSSPLKLAYPLKQAAEVSGLSVRSLRYLMAAGRLGHVRVGRKVLIRHADLEALLKRGSVKARVLDPEAFIRPDAGKHATKNGNGRSSTPRPSADGAEPLAREGLTHA